jgi:hypothetical protein
MFLIAASYTSIFIQPSLWSSIVRELGVALAVASLIGISVDSFFQKHFFREKVFKMLKDNNRISDTLIFKMRHWNHSGFSVNNEVYINKDNPEALERLAQYIVHSSFSADKIKYIEETGSVMYKSKMHLGKKRNFEALYAIEFIHRICLHIPDHYESLIRYYGSSSLKALKNKILLKCCTGQAQKIKNRK